MHAVIAYDVESDLRRRRVMNRLKDFGLRAQYSVFEVDLAESQMRGLINELREMINPRTDRLHVYRLCQACYLCSEAYGAEYPGGDL